MNIKKELAIYSFLGCVTVVSCSPLNMPENMVNSKSIGQVSDASITPTTKGQVPTSSITPATKGQTIIKGKVVLPSNFSLLSETAKPLPIFDVKASTLAGDIVATAVTDEQGYFEIQESENAQRLIFSAIARDNHKIVLESLLDIPSVEIAEINLEINPRSTGITRMMLDEGLEKTIIASFDLNELETSPLLKEIVDEIEEFVTSYLENDISEALEELDELNTLLAKSRKGLTDYQSEKEAKDIHED